MKTTTLLISMITLFTFNVLGQGSNVKALLENRDTREEIFSIILNDHNLMMEFMDQMNGNEHAMAMMRGNHKMMMNLQEESQMQGGHMGTGHGMMGQEEEAQTQSGHMGTGHGMMGMTDDSELIQKMGHMMDRCKTDSTVCMEMTAMIAQHPDMMRMMMRMMHQKGIIESDTEQKDHHPSE